MLLDTIIEFYNCGKTTQALKLYEELPNKDSTSLAYKSIILNRMDRNQESWEIANKMYEESFNETLEKRYIAMVIYAKSVGPFGKSNWNLSRKIAQDANDLYEQMDTISRESLKRWKAELLFDKAILFFISDPDPKKIASLSIEAPNLFKEMGDEWGRLFADSFLSTQFLLTGNPGKTIEKLKINLEVSTQKKLKGITALCQTLIAAVLLITGQSGALSLFQEAVKLESDHESVWITTFARMQLGRIYYLSGNLEKAIVEINIGLKYAKQTHDRHFYAFNLMSLGDIDRLRGEVDNAVDRFKESKFILEELRDLNCTIDVNLKLGRGLLNQNNYSEARECLLKALNIRGWYDKNGKTLPKRNYFYCEVLIELIVVSLELSLEDDVSEYYSLIRDFCENQTNQKNQYLVRLAEALIDKNKTRSKYKIKAQNALEALVKEGSKDSELHNLVIIHYCELLVEELKLHGEEEVLDEIKGLLRQSRDFAVKRKLLPLQIESILMEAIIMVLAGEGKEALKKFDEAHKIALDYHLTTLKKKIDRFKQEIEGEIGRWKNILDKNTTLRERIEKTKITNYIHSALKQRDLLSD